MRPLGFSKAKLLTKFEVSNSCSFEDMFDRICQNCRGHVSRDLGQAPFRENYSFQKSSCFQFVAFKTLS